MDTELNSCLIESLNKIAAEWQFFTDVKSQPEDIFTRAYLTLPDKLYEKYILPFCSTLLLTLLLLFGKI